MALRVDVSTAPSPARGDELTGPGTLGLAPHVVFRVRTFMADNLGKRLGVKEMAQLACLSEFHFCRQFKVATGESPHRFFTRVRMEHAKRMLEHSGLSLREIASRVGYATQASFTHAFRDFSGRSPGRYRESVRPASSGLSASALR